MRCGDLEVVVVERGSHLEGDDARAVARRVVCAALLDVPRLGLGKMVLLWLSCVISTVPSNRLPQSNTTRPD